MNILLIFLLCLASFLVGLNMGYIKGAMDFEKIIDTYKETIETYREALGLKQ